MTDKQKKVLCKFFNNPKALFEYFYINFITYLINSDELYLKIYFRLFMPYKLNLVSPKTFQEKIQWLKLYDRRPLYTQLVDKYSVKEIVSSKIGEKYIIPTIKIWDNPNDIDFTQLPDSFVMKCTHDSGKIVICREKDKLDIGYVRSRMGKALKKSFWRRFREYPYRDVKPRIIVEELIKYKNNSYQDLYDYKFYCFGGEPLYCQVIRDRSTTETIDFYDSNWIHQDFVGLSEAVKNGKTPIDKPVNFEEMKDVCRHLSEDYPFVRVDLYNVDGNIYFGELTFFPAGGVGTFSPNEWNIKLGDLIKIT